jgi:hypothetical protein
VLLQKGIKFCHEKPNYKNTGHHHLKSLHQVEKSLQLTDQGKKNSGT